MRFASVRGMETDEADSNAQTCSVCYVKAPPTETNYTLISSRHGWRLSIETLPDGKRNPVWRCPSCWQEYKTQAAKGAKPSTSPRRH